MNIATLASLLCNDLVRRVCERGARNFIVTQFQYPDGDFVNVYFEPRGEHCYITDCGQTSLKLRMNGMRMTEDRVHRIQSVCNMHQVKIKHGIMEARLDGAEIGKTFLSFCESIVRISGFALGLETRGRSSLKDQIEKLVRRKIRGDFTRNWTARNLDPNGSHPVDFRFNGAIDPRHLFYVTTPTKSNLVAAVTHFLQLNGIDVPTLSIIDPGAKLGERQIDRLQLASSEILFGVTGNERLIVEFASGEH